MAFLFSWWGALCGAGVRDEKEKNYIRVYSFVLIMSFIACLCIASVQNLEINI